ncbi:hypothetical protein CVT26_012713 [Gymnopilus dilepis]|uniref:Protein kinase domain-containing protein n=1 Tax=Gymnopilus dilepis TaxID=231916 RepID=A0A409YPG1_9AGAR|nr:hypothetical protein CVT26_012713 [Gymnopilus dilepis]
MSRSPPKSSPTRSPSATPVNRTISLPDSSGNPSPRVSSPLNPSNTPKKSPAALPSSQDIVDSPLDNTRRARSSEDVRDAADNVTTTRPHRPLSMTLTHTHGETSSILLPDIDSSEIKSTFRERSLSPARKGDSGDHLATANEGSNPKLSTSWWGEKHVAQPWRDPPKKKRSLPPEQVVALEETRVRVAQAVVSTLGTAADVVHEALYVGVELFDLAPVPGLSLAARTLLNIWDAAQNVDMNRLGCLRLTERCADVLISVREEVHEAGDEVGAELASPLAKLEEAYTFIYRFMVKQTNRPWLKRYLKRDEILRDIAACDSMLRDALSVFGLSIQIRILKQVQESERRREREAHMVLDAILAGHNIPPTTDFKMILGSETEMISPQTSPYVVSSDFSTETVTKFTTTKNALGLEEAVDSPISENPTSAEVLPALTKIHSYQNSLDATRDLTDLRQLMRNALQTSNDAELLGVLQIGRQEMPDAIKTLQRALERLAEQDEDGFESIPSVPSPEVVLAKVTRKLSVKEGEDNGGTTQRSETIVSIESSSSSDATTGDGSKGLKRRDTLDREFIESGIDALTRMSRGTVTSVPSWTITKYEVDRDEKIGVGFFSDVYKGTWRGRTVAIKVLADTTPRRLFVREMGIWKSLRHANVLPLYGASSATGDPPWFFVSPYMKNGSLVEHLKRVEMEERPLGLGVGVGAGQAMASMLPRSQGGRATTLPSPWLGLHPSDSSSTLIPPGTPKRPLPNDSSDVQRQWDLFRFMHEISKGMEYLHSKGIHHGDLKASNVLVDNKYRCVISDFGLSEMKSEAFRISGTPPPHGTLRWQSPELMAGRSQLTPAADVWAFGITCVEILTMGRMPWPLMDDNAVRHFVLVDKTTPPIPKYSRFNTPGLQDILRGSWQFDPDKRPPFTKIAQNFKLLRKSYGHGTSESPSPGLTPLQELPEYKGSPSPDMRPIETLPHLVQTEGSIPPPDILAGPPLGRYNAGQSSQQVGTNQPLQESTVPIERVQMPEPVIFTPGPSSRSSSVLLSSSVHSEDRINVVDLGGYESPPPENDLVAETKDERRYRMLLTHEYHPSLTLPLWTPSQVELGAVGYLSRPKGEFVTLFNAYEPRKSDQRRIQSLPSVHGYGSVKDDVQRLPKKTITQKAFDMIVGSLTFRNSSEAIVRRPTFPLKAGHKAAYLYTEITEYRYMLTLDAPKAWFQSNVDTIVNTAEASDFQCSTFNPSVIGTLRTPNYALFVSHSHPEGHARFNVYANPKVGEKWGSFTTDTEVPHDFGPLYDLDDSSEIPRQQKSKVSNHGDPWTAVLLARLRFKPDVLEPTSR